MTDQERIKKHREQVAFLNAGIQREVAAAKARIEAVKAEEEQRLKLLISRARISAEASARANLPAGYVMNSDSMIREWSGWGR